MELAITTWAEIEEQCPIDISRIKHYGKKFKSLISFPINLATLDMAKVKLFESRNNLDLMITTLMHLLDNTDILVKKADKILYSWLKEDLGRILASLDKFDTDIASKDDPNKIMNKVGISSLLAYEKRMKNIYYSLFETLIKSIKEWQSLDKERKKEPRTFFYIFFCKTQIVISLLGSLTREQQKISAKGLFNQYPMGYENLLSESGQSQINEIYKNDPEYKKMEIPSNFLEEMDSEVTSSEADEDA